MKAWEVLGYTADGAIYCPDCAPSEDDPIFAISEGGDSPDHCNCCDALIPVSLTSDGMEYVKERLESEQGRPAVLELWRKVYLEHYIPADLVPRDEYTPQCKHAS